MGKCANWVKQWGDVHYLIFRILVGGMFLLHGYTILWGEQATKLASFMGFIGAVELLVGLAVLVGFFSRLAATGGAIVMIGAYFKVHAGQGWNPLANGGELALLYLAAFLVVMMLGNGKWNLEESLLNKETF